MEVADVGLHVLGDEVEDVVGKRRSEARGLPSGDLQARLIERGLELADHPLLEPADQALGQRRDLERRRVARQDDLAVPLVQLVERVEKFFLAAVLVRDEVDVVDDQDLGLAVLAPERVELPPLDRGDELVDEELARDVDDPQRARP